ncbi:MAG TPA: hypothetical protein VF080_08175 [Solirubrobacteraceae bacterium]
MSGPAEETIGHGDARRPSSRAVAAALVGVPYTGKRMEEFDNELRYFNWGLILVLNAAFAAGGARLARRGA